MLIELTLPKGTELQDVLTAEGELRLSTGRRTVECPVVLGRAGPMPETPEEAAVALNSLLNAVDEVTRHVRLPQEVWNEVRAGVVTAFLVRQLVRKAG